MNMLIIFIERFREVGSREHSRRGKSEAKIWTPESSCVKGDHWLPEEVSKAFKKYGLIAPWEHEITHVIIYVG